MSDDEASYEARCHKETRRWTQDMVIVASQPSLSDLRDPLPGLAALDAALRVEARRLLAEHNRRLLPAPDLRKESPS